MFLTATMAVQAQIVIGGSVYGGGNEGNVGGSTSVTVRAGDIDKVYGGARIANVAGNAFVHIDGEHASNYILINYVYGGNDIAGSIGTNLKTFDVPTSLTRTAANNIDGTWNAFVRISDNAAHTQKTYIGQLFGGSNGEYYYEEENGVHKIYDYKDHTKLITSTTHQLSEPNLKKTYLEILGGSIVYAYGGGNNATITEKTVICLDNPSTVVGSIIDTNSPNAGTGGELLYNDRFENKMGINTTFTYPNSGAFQIGRLFGGNNKAAMAIRPRWNLQSGSVRNLYGGGNEGRMTSPEGLLLQIEGAGMKVDNVYGGCRRADVRPLYDNDDERPVDYADIQLDPNDNPNKIPGGYAARVRILGGDVNNVYGGNDISGNVYGGNTVGILSTVHGNVYGGGNGSYAYTDNDKLKDDPKWHDFYYSPKEILGLNGNTFTGLQSAEALNVFRPNAEKVSILVRGTAEKPVVVEGALYVGGNSASLREQVSGGSGDNSEESQTHIKIGSYVTIDNVFLGNNGENMIKYNDADDAITLRGEGVLKTYSKFVKADGTLVDTQVDGATKFNSMLLKDDADVFAKYMEGCAMKVKPGVLFESTGRGDPNNYISYTTQFGSFFCGGNVGSILVPGKLNIVFDHEVIIYDKLVGGCNNAKVTASSYNAEYLGGLIGDADPVAEGLPAGSVGDKLKLNLSGLKIEPKRWNSDHSALVWNTYIGDTACDPVTETAPSVSAENPIHASEDDMNRRLKGGNIYGGCCESGIVNGNVIINVNANLVNVDDLFDEVLTDPNDGEASLYHNNELGYNQEHYHITKRRSGVILAQQGMDVLSDGLNLYGGGKGEGTEIWGSTTINLNKGFVFQVFGGSEKGVIGKSGDEGTGDAYTFNGKTYKYNDKYSCYVNLKGSAPGTTKASGDNVNMPECVFLYGGGFEGPVVGNSIVRLGNGRVFDSFGGSCDADILGHTETYVGYRHNVEDHSGTVTGQVDGFPWIRDIVYGGNDLGGMIKGKKEFSGTDYLRTETDGKRHSTDVLTASSYVEYRQGRADGIVGGSCGTYDYGTSGYNRTLDKKPYIDNAFVNFRPTSSDILKNPEKKNVVAIVYGGSQGYPGDFDSNKMQNRSYVLVDIPEDMENYKDMKVFGAGAWGGLGMRTKVESNDTEANRDKHSAIIDLVRGQIDAAYGASYKTGFTRRTVVNVPDGSKIQVNNLFGGAYGENLSMRCDAYEANVNYNSSDAIVKNAIFGGNNAFRRTLYGRVNINAPVKTGELDNNNESKLATVYGAGYGEGTWSQYTEVNLNNGARVAEVYGGGQAGRVMNTNSLAKWKEETDADLTAAYNTEHAAWEALSDEEKALTAEPVLSLVNLSLGDDYTDVGLNDPLVKSNPLGVADLTWKTGKFNTNVYINEGSIIDVSLVTKSYGPGYDGGYAYAGGYGYSDVDGSGDVYGTTYIGLFGGTVKKDIYAGGTVGSVMNRYVPEKIEQNNEEIDNPDYFTAGTYAYIAGGTARNVYGGGWQGSVGKHQGATVTIDGKQKFLPVAGSTDNDVLGESTVVVGIRKDLRDAQKPTTLPTTLNYMAGVPAIQRNVYSGGEGGAVYGTANLIINNGYIGYYYDTSDNKYKEKLNDETWSDGIGENRLEDCGNAFGGGYDDLSSVDYTNVKMYGGVIRNSLHGGGEIATVGRGTTKQTTGVVRELNEVYKNGKTHVEMYNGNVLHNVFGGGKGYNKLKYGVGNELYTDGYVFGQTEVYIHGGEIGTAAGAKSANSYGNVFGAGDIGYVYSSGYEYSRTQNKETGSPGHIYYYKPNTNELTEDCKVIVSPYLQVKPDNSVEYGGKTYLPYDYVPTDYLNTLGKKTSVTATGTKDWPAKWKKLITEEEVEGQEVDRGVIIHNGVFGGGNVSTNSDKTYANATTVFGNVTATLYDVFHRDFISIGTEHIGGLYGGGNYSMVDGYRELNITNYGTDYFSLDQQINLDTYRGLSNRERAYFKLKYECKATTTFGSGNNASREYTAGEKIDEDVYLRLLERYGTQVENSFTPWGICSIYAGRLLNTIQRADFCGVFGSRMVLQGARDRVADTEQNTDYTINRVGELSLNKMRSVRVGEGYSDPDTGDDFLHGNYFGIYSVVNYMGNLTSDQHFDDDYEGPAINTNVTPNVPYEGYGQTTYYSYKAGNSTSGKRNLAKCPHQVALASGVHLELTTEKSTEETKDYGYITGVVELDLINVKKDKVMGGGFVYAKNEHRVPKFFPNKKNVLLSDYNQREGDEAITNKRYCYEASKEPTGSEAANPRIVNGGTSDAAYSIQSYQTSGNFIHPEKKIVDDCYPTNNAYDLQAHLLDPTKAYSEAHYWYVKGEVYVYDQIVTAYTGSASAYQRESQLNLTITAASNGRLQLLNVKPNLYAYKMPLESGSATKVKIGSVEDADGNPIDQVTVNNEHDTYKLNDVITWWDWHQLNEDERANFVTNTYVNCVTIKVGEGENAPIYEPGTYVLDETDKTTAETQFTDGTLIIKDAEGNTIKKADGTTDADFDYIFRSSNNISHDEGYVLTFDMSTPTIWGKYYTAKDRSTTPQTTQTERADDLSAPTFHPVTGGVFGKQNYTIGEIITKATVDAYSTGFGDAVEPAYVAINKVNYTSGETTAIANAGSAISQTVYGGITDNTVKANFEPAKVCISTVKLADGVYLGYGELKSATQIRDLKDQYAIITRKVNEQEITEPDEQKKNEIDEAMKDAYIFVKAGEYGGQEFSNTKNYDVIDAWCALSKDDRTNGGFTFNQDALDLLASPSYLSLAGANPQLFPTESDTKTAYGNLYGQRVPIEYKAICKTAFDSYTVGQEISQTDFEALPNDQRHYTRVELETGSNVAYIVIDNFTYNGVPYGKGQVVDIDTYTDINDNNKIVSKTFADAGETYYYCYEDYSTHHRGEVMVESDYDDLPNDQKNFIIQGKEPVETSTLYVSSQSDINDVLKERVYSVVYQYTYYEDEDNNNVKFTNELHVINVHVQMESGVPVIGPLASPDVVIPGTAVNMTTPDVTVGSYPPLGNGWEIYSNEQDAKLHRNGEAYNNGVDPLYWYQNGDYYINFYSKNYLGKIYAPKAMPLRVANYHDLDAVMKDKEHHMYVDRPDVDRASKIYIDNRTCESDATKSELDLLKDFFDLSLQTEKVTTEGAATKDHELLDNHVHGARNLEFILRSDVSPKKYTTWNSIGTKTVGETPGQCFEGNLHGDGYTISGLSSSLFNNLCGEVYNLGVTGTFTSSGIVEEGTGYLENCWVKKTNAGTVTSGTKALFGTTTNTETRTVHMVNCYYPQENGYTAQTGATEKPLKAFYDGEVAYDLNDFYLFKRYCDNKTLTGNDTYKYYQKTLTNTEGEKTNDNATLSLVENGRYESQSGPYLLDVGSYVEWRYADGDFLYANGSVPSAKNERVYTVTEGNNKTEYYYPIWPDDYIFFGQALNYDQIDGRTHQAEPSAIRKLGGRLLDTEENNRVYRAPAYFGNSTMSVAHFNPYAVFAQSKKDDASVVAYKGMTAIDFSGNNDGSYQYGQQSVGFYPPLLDDDGVVEFTNVDLTRNLLVYTDATNASATTENTVKTKLIEETYQETDDTYHTVAEAHNLRQEKTVRGHWVQKVGDVYKATRDHYLVDKEDFNAPISYTFDTNNRMWYQRLPENYVGKRNAAGTGFIDNSAGWEGVSLPFTAELVTTNTKGEITHFYNYSDEDEDHSKGHEYWLREYKGGALKSGSTDIFEANFSKPDAGTEDKAYTNTFLWDYYYKINDYDDLNSDKFPGSYYSASHDYTNYPRLASATPYIMGFPGERYYEFDLSGKFEAKTALITPAKLAAQIITFASAEGATIGVSDTELTNASENGYAFVPNYAKKTLTDVAYILNTGDEVIDNRGNSYKKVASGAVTVPFRPYFIASAPANSRMVGEIVFGQIDGQFGVDEKEPGQNESEGGLLIYTKKHKIVVESTLTESTEVCIITAAGVLVNTLTIEPGQTVETYMTNRGVYLVQTADGRHRKKLAVK